MSLIGYVPGNSLAHRLDPVTKIVLLGCFCLVAVMTRSTLRVIGAMAVAIMLVWTSGIGLHRSLGKIRVVVLLCSLLFLAQVIFETSGRPLFAWELRLLGLRAGVMATTGGILSGARIACRLMTIVMAGVLFVGTTDPSQLATALMSRGMPYRYGFMLVLALRFVPLFQMEASTVRTAQAARGLRVDRPGPRTLVRLARYTFMPLLVSALARIETVSASMEGRGFGLRRTRTFLRATRFRATDWIVIAVSVALVSGAVLL